MIYRAVKYVKNFQDSLLEFSVEPIGYTNKKNLSTKSGYINVQKLS